MKDLVLRSLGAGAALFAMAAPMPGQAAPPPAGPAMERCLAVQAESLDVSGVASVVGPGMAATYARGVTGAPGSPPIGAQSRFNLGSAGKMFTAVAVAQLIEAGKVGLDDPVGRYVTGLTPQAAAVTVRQLLTHSGGLGDFFTPQNLPAIARARTVAELMPLVASDRPAFTPGARFEYSNSGFLILGRLVERVSGQDYGRYLSDHVFAPAGMTATGLEPGPAATRAVGMTAMPPPSPGAAAGPPQMMRLPGPGQPPAPPPAGPLRPSIEASLRGNPAGGAYGTAADMQRFFAALLAGRLVSAPMLQKLTTTQIVAMPAHGPMAELDYGLGFGVGVSGGHRWFGHNGGAPGVTVEATAYPDDRVAMVVMANRDPPSASLLFRQVRGALFDPAVLRKCAGGD